MNNPYPGLSSKHNEATAIVQALTPTEKASLCSGQNFWHLKGIERVKLPEVMVTDGPHGLRKQAKSADHVGLNRSVPATCFPTAVTLAASWNVALLEEIGQALGQQCIEENVAVLLGPGLNIKRHPYCGRNFEYFSEDPYLSGHCAAAMVRGVQSQGVGTSIKHFAVNNQENGRMILDAVVDERTLREIYLRGFEIAVKEAQPWTVMCAYNRVNGPYCSEHDWLLNQVLREEWGFEGLVVTDWGAANDRVQGVKSGLDLEMPGSGGINDEKVLTALENGELDEQTLDKTMVRNVAVSLLGQDVQQNEVAVDFQAHHNLARRAAIEGTVLLKNDDNLLPLASSNSVAVIGEFAKHPRFQGAGSSQVNPTELENAWTAMTEYTDSLLFAPGYDAKNPQHEPDLISDAVKAAKQADVAIVFAGLPSLYESEAFDRTHMNLPDQHNRLIQAVCAVNPNTVVVLSNGAPVTMPWVDAPKSIVESYLLGQAGGTAIADILFGAANPSGKLAESFPWSASDILADQWFPGQPRQVQYREGLAVGYRHHLTAQTPVMYPFGHGLSYTNFDYTNPAIEVLSQSPIQVKVSLDITNTGAMDGSEAIQLYVHDKEASVFRPAAELAAFTKVELTPGQSHSVELLLDMRSFAIYDVGNQDWVVEGGTFEIRIGASSQDIRHVLEIELDGTGDITETARHNTPPDYLDQLNQLPKATFENALGRTIPEPDPEFPYHLNTSVRELTTTWLGRKVRQRMMNQFLSNMGGNSEDKTLNKMMAEMVNNMPLRGIAMFSRGKLSFHVLEVLIAVMNGEISQAIKIWARYKIEQGEKKARRKESQKNESQKRL
ncbi:MAG: glycoside hydrolase family 3 C-terminal domain-containing protein [Pseudomonadota bacterium]